MRRGDGLGPYRRDITKRDTLVLRSLTKHYRTSINRRSDYLNLAGFLCFGLIYLTVLIFQRTAPEAYGVTSVLETVAPEKKVLSTRNEVFSWLESTVTKIWNEPDCGDGICEAPVEFPGYDRFGCKADCGSVLDAYKNISGLHVDLYYDFTNQPGALSFVDGLPTVSWNLCPAAGSAEGKKGMGGVPHGTECFYAQDQKLTAVSGNDHIVIPEIADGEWELRISGDLMWKVAAAVRYHNVLAPEAIQGKSKLATQAALSAIEAEQARLNTALAELAKAADGGVIVIEYIKRDAATKIAAIDVLERTNAYSPAYATAQRKLVTDAETKNISDAQSNTATCVNRFVSAACEAHYNKVDVAVAEHYSLQRENAKKIAGQAQLDALTALVSFKTQLATKVPELAYELDHMVTNPSKYILANATEEDKRLVRASIETLMELEVNRLQALAKTKLAPAVVDATANSGLANLITLRRNEIDSILTKNPALGVGAFTELSALNRAGGGAAAYKSCDLKSRAARGYAGTCVTTKPAGYDAERCTGVCQCGKLQANSTVISPGCNATKNEVCVCDKCAGTMSLGGRDGSATAAGRRRALLATPSADEKTLAELTKLQTSTAALEASLAAVQTAQTASISAERAHHESTSLSDSIASGFASVDRSIGSLSTIITGVAPVATTVIQRATEIETRAAKLASEGADRLALIADSLTANEANARAAYTAGYATAASRDAMIRKMNLKAMSDEMEAYLSSKPCAVSSRSVPFSLTSGGRKASVGVQRKRTVGLTNRVVGGLIVYVKRAGQEQCDTRFNQLQNQCLDQSSDNTAPYGVDPAFTRGSSFYSPDFDANAATKLYNCSAEFGAAASYDAAGGNNYSPFCKQLFDQNRIPYGFHPANTQRFTNGYPVFFDINLSKDNAIRWLRYLRESFVFDDKTTSVETQLITYNAEIRYFGSMVVNFFFNPAGSIEVSKDISAVRVELYENRYDVARGVFEGLLTFAVIASAWFEFSDLRRAKKTHGNYMAYFESGWNYIDLISIGITFAAICYWWTYVNVITRGVNVEPRYDVYQDLEAPARLFQLSDNGAGLTRAFDELSDVSACARYLSLYVTLMSINIVFYVARILKFMNFQPRIGLVTRTLAIAASDLVHFFVLAIVVFIGYGIMGHLLFGSQIEAFSTMSDALQTNFEMLLGEVTVADQMMDLVGPSIEFAAVLYFWSYQIFVFMILLNFLIAIIVDAFSEVKATLSNEKSMYEEIGHIFKQKYIALGARFWAKGNEEYVTEDKVETQLRKWAKASAAMEDEDEEEEVEESEAEKVFKVGDEEITKEELEEVIARAITYSQGKFNLWNVKGDIDLDEDFKNPDLDESGRQALRRQRRPLPTAEDVSKAAEMIMEKAGTVQVDPLYDDEVTKAELSQALNDVVAGQNRLAQMHNDLVALLDKRGGSSARSIRTGRSLRGGLLSGGSSRFSLNPPSTTPRSGSGKEM